MYRLLAAVQGLQERNKTKKNIDKKKASSRLQEKRTKIRNVTLKFLVYMYQELCSFSGIVINAFGRTDLWKAIKYDEIGNFLFYLWLIKEGLSNSDCTVSNGKMIMNNQLHRS
jgi:hypothetical protein